MIEKIEIEGIGFNVLKDYDSWRIAQLGYDENSNSIEGVSRYGRHMCTDEVFMLIEGKAYMFTRGCENTVGPIQLEVMEKNKLYTVKEKQWHAAVLTKKTKVLIVENRNTNDSNSDSYTINKEELEIMASLIEDIND